MKPHCQHSDVFPLYRMSYMWYTFFGAFVAITVAHLGILIYGRTDPNTIDPTLLAPFLRRRYTTSQPGKNAKIQLTKMAPLQSESSL